MSSSPPGGFLAFSARVAIQCFECRWPIPLDGILHEVGCSMCESFFRLDERVWRCLLAGRIQRSIEAPGMISTTAFDDLVNAAIEYGMTPATCHGCQGILPLHLLPFTLQRGMLTCPACSVAHRVRAADALTQRLHPGVRFVLGEGGPLRSPRAIPDKAMTCLGCGAASEVDGRSRIVTCKFCNAPSCIPETLWLELHPAPTRSRFFLVIEEGVRGSTAKREGLDGITYSGGAEPEADGDVTLAIRFSLDCPECGRPVTVPGFVSSALCPTCHFELQLPASEWAGYFSRDAQRARYDARYADPTNDLGAVVSRRECARAPARCAGCHRVLSAGELRNAARFGGLQCGCGATTSVRPADGLARAVDSRAELIIAEGRVGTLHAPLREPVAFACLGCGAPLKVDGGQRILRCDRCGEQSFVPDGIWIRLQPTPKMNRFYLRLA